MAQGIAFLILVFLVQCCNSLYQSDDYDKSALPNNKYLSYLQYPHINFRGRFKANVATGNNVYKNYESDNFIANHDSYSNDNGGKNQWNPYGTNDFILMDCYVSSACHAEGNCTSKAKHDSVCGNLVTDGGIGPFAKIVDIDTAYQSIPEIWGLKITVPGFFVGDMKATPLIEYWPRLGAGDSGKGGIYQSVLKNIIWEKKSNSSKAINQMKATMQAIGSSELSIIFYLDRYSLNSGILNFAIGRIIGTIGVSGPLSPKFFTSGRSLAPVFIKQHGESKKKKNVYKYMHNAAFVIERSQNRLYINFENSLKLFKNGNPLPLPGQFRVGYLKKELKNQNNSNMECSNIVFLGEFPKANLIDWYWNYSGILSLALSDKDMMALDNRSLALFQIEHKRCSVIMQENNDGIIVKPMGAWVFRLQPGQFIHVQFLVTKFGKPLPNSTVTITPTTSPFDPVPGSGHVGKAQFTSISFKTNQSGIACAKIPTIASKFQRTGLDGNLEGYPYIVQGSAESKRLGRSELDSMIVAHVYHSRNYTEPITWIDHVYPIFRQYANLYPVMSSRSFDMANFFDIVDHKDIMQLSLQLPMSHPSFMPATRDLSEARLKMILSWLSQDKPAFGDVTKVLTKHYLKSLLHLAIEVSHAAFPPILTAIWSIKHNYNKKVRGIIDGVAWQEIQKIGLLCNLLTAVGGKPKLLHKSFVPNYGSRLPGGIKRDIILSLEKLSMKSLLNQLELKKPEYDSVGLFFRKAIFERMEEIDENCPCTKTHNCTHCYNATRFSNSYKKCRLAMSVLINQSKFADESTKGYDAYVDPQDRHVFEYHSSIGQFYNHILLVIAHLTDCGSNNTLFLSGKRSLQLVSKEHETVFGNIFGVYDFVTAVKAIRAVLDITHSLDSNFRSQYASIRAMVDEKSSLPVINVRNQIPKIMEQASVNLVKELREKIQQPLPRKVKVFGKGVWPIAANCRHDMYPNGRAKNLSMAFNTMYSLFLMSIEKIYKTSNTIKRKSHITKMFLTVDALGTYSRKLVRTPINEHGDRNVGPNAAPTFELDFNFLRLAKMPSVKMLKNVQKGHWTLDMYFKLRKRLEYESSLPQSKGRSTRKPAKKKMQKGDEVDEEDEVFLSLAKNPLADVSQISNN